MATDRFSSFLPFIFQWECVFDRKGNVIAENVTGDGGGVTKYGIDVSGHPNLTAHQINNLTKEQATDIYWKEWQKFGCEHYPTPLGEVFFNCTVNCGIGRANKILAKGVKTAGEFLEEQEDFYNRLVEAKPRLKKFLAGWLNRTKALHDFLKLEGKNDSI